MLKKIILLIITFLINIPISLAQELDITNDIEYRYKWYTEEIIDEIYYPKKDNLEGYLEDPTKITYGKELNLNSKNCNLSSENYLISKERIEYNYKTVFESRYLVFENFNYSGKVIILYNNKIINYQIIEQTSEKLTIDLQKNYDNKNITIILDAPQNFHLKLYCFEPLKKINLEKEIINEQVINITDASWITPSTQYVTYNFKEKVQETDLIKYVGENHYCKVKEIYTYRYKVKRNYYDDNYYSSLEGYIKDTEDYKIYYLKELPTTTITQIEEKIKVVKEKETQPEYIYIEKPIVSSSTKEVIKKEYIEKKIPYIPKIFYVASFILLVICLLMIIKYVKICRRN